MIYVLKKTISVSFLSEISAVRKDRFTTSTVYQILNTDIFYKCNGHLLSFFAFKAGKCRFMFYAFIEGIPKKTSPE